MSSQLYGASDFLVFPHLDQPGMLDIQQAGAGRGDKQIDN
jgi:hypothetical protein